MDMLKPISGVVLVVMAVAVAVQTVVEPRSTTRPRKKARTAPCGPFWAG